MLTANSRSRWPLSCQLARRMRLACPPLSDVQCVDRSTWPLGEQPEDLRSCHPGAPHAGRVDSQGVGSDIDPCGRVAEDLDSRSGRIVSVVRGLGTFVAAVAQSVRRDTGPSTFADVGDDCDVETIRDDG